MPEQPEGGGSVGSLDPAAQYALSSGRITRDQLADARQLVQQMRALGVERDILGALVDRKVLTPQAADEIRRQAPAAAAAAPAAAAPEAPEIEEAESLEEAEATTEDVRIAETAPPAAASAGGGAVSCVFHPGVPAINWCSNCSRPICKQCVIRTEKGYYCSEDCMNAARTAGRRRGIGGQIDEAVRLGRMLSWAGALVVVAGIAWLVKYIVDDYRFSFAMQRAASAGVAADEATSQYRKAVDLRPKDVKARLGYARALLASGEAGTAIEHLSKALEIAPSDIDALRTIAEAYRQKSEYEKAKDALVRLRQAGGTDSDTERFLGEICQDRLDLPEEAVEAYRRSISIGSESRELRYRMGKALISLGRLEEAREELGRAVAPLTETSGPTYARERSFLAASAKLASIHEALAELAEKEGDSGSVLKSLAKAHELDPGRLSALERYVKMLMGAGKHGEAMAAAKRSQGQLRKDAEYLELLAELQERSGAAAEGLATLRQLHKVEPGRPGLLERLIRAEAERGDRSEAKRLLQLLPRDRFESEEFADVWEAIIYGELAGGDASGAEESLRTISALVDREPGFAAYWCDVLHRQGRDREALERAEVALRSRPDNPAPYLVVGSVLRSMGRSREALEKVRAAVKRGAGGKAEYQIGLIAWDAGLEKDAAQRFRSALADPKLPRHIKAELELLLARLRGPGLPVREKSEVDQYLEGKLDAMGKEPGTLLWQTHLASYGVARLFSQIAGTVGAAPVGDELQKLDQIAYATAEMDNPQAYAQIRVESDRAVKACAQAVRLLAPRAASAEVDKVMAAYSSTSQTLPELGQIAAAARAGARLIAAWLSHHPKKDQIALQVRMALSRMRGRECQSPGDVQSAVAADCALCELAATAVGAGMNAPAYRTAANGALTEMATTVGKCGDPLAQLCASRVAAYRMLWILSRQILETGSVRRPTAAAR